MLCHCETHFPGPENNGRGRDILAELTGYDAKDCEKAESAATILSSNSGFEYSHSTNTVHIPRGSIIVSKEVGEKSFSAHTVFSDNH